MTGQSGKGVKLDFEKIFLVSLKVLLVLVVAVFIVWVVRDITKPVPPCTETLIGTISTMDLEMGSWNVPDFIKVTVNEDQYVFKFDHKTYKTGMKLYEDCNGAYKIK